MIKPKSLKHGQWQKNKEGKLLQHSKATFDILMAKYKECRAGITGHKNRTIRKSKQDSPVSLSPGSTSTVEGSSNKRSQTPPQ
jgi:hypothetical protein